MSILVRCNVLGRELHKVGEAKPNDLFLFLVRCILGGENKL